jgi:hypothetical protein
MKMKLKEFILFFVTFLGGTYAASYVTAFFNIRATDVFSSLIVALVPALFVFVIWKKWMQKAAGKAGAK